LNSLVIPIHSAGAVLTLPRFKCQVAIKFVSIGGQQEEFQDAACVLWQF